MPEQPANAEDNGADLRARKQKNRAIAWCIAGFALLVYLLAIGKFSA